MSDKNLIKFVFIGDSYTGKSLNISLFLKEKYENNISLLRIFEKEVTFLNDTYTFRIIDTSGIQDFLSNLYFVKNAQCLLFFYNITNEETFQDISGRIILSKLFFKDSILILVGNYKDKENKRKVIYEEGEELANIICYFMKFLL